MSFFVYRPYAPISPLESQNSPVWAILLTGWVWGRLRGEDADLRQGNSAALLMKGAYEGASPVFS